MWKSIGFYATLYFCEGWLISLWPKVEEDDLYSSSNELEVHLSERFCRKFKGIKFCVISGSVDWKLQVSSLCVVIHYLHLKGSPKEVHEDM